MIEPVKLGGTDLTVSKICFGASGLGDMPDTYGYDVSEARAKATVAAILDSPINFIDTSRIYGFGRSEERIGAVIRERGGLPKGFVLSTKLDRDPDTGRFDASQARRSLEQSLAALGVDKIDLLHLHDPEHGASLSEVTAVGLAAGSVSVMMPMLRDFDFDALITHNRFTLANRNAEAMIDFAYARGIAVLNAAPYAGGVLAKGSGAYARYVYQEASPELLDPIRRIEAICAKHGAPPGAVALQFSMRDPRITSTICGVSKPERVLETLEWARFPVPDIVWKELEGVGYSLDDPEASRTYRPG
jgi:D-threo-aldose 1-dehydrogenase